MSKALLITSSYLPCLSCFRLYTKHQGDIVIETNAYFIKHSMQNRAKIMSSSGSMYLTIPIVKRNKTKTPIKDILISDSYNWQRIHSKTIYLNYKNSPFYDFYYDKLNFIYNKKYKYLIDINNDCLSILSSMLNISLAIRTTTSYYPNYNEDDYIDVRDSLSYDNNSVCTYNQVFEDRFGFIKNLSIIDLIFNAGPKASSLLLK